jgi:D-xylose transport system permease protein
MFDWGNNAIKKFRLNIKNNVTQFAIIIELLIIFIFFQIATGGLFISNTNLTNLLMQGCTFSIIAVGMVLVMVSGGIDLSAGSVLGFLATFAATMEVNVGMKAIPTILLTLLIGLLIGCWHGYWIAYRNLPAFIVTLSGMLIFKGLTLLVGKGVGVGPSSDEFSKIGSAYLPEIFFKGTIYNDTSIIFTLLIILIYIIVAFRVRRSMITIGLPVPSLSKFIGKNILVSLIIVLIGGVMISYQGIPYAIVLLMIMAIIYTFISNNTVFGRAVFAIGSNVDAARLSGINVEHTLFRIYISMGLVTAIASIVFLGRVGYATAMTGQNFEFNAITGCIVGGTSTLGGTGTIIGAIIGTILMASLDNGMSLLNLGTTFQFIAKGLVLLLAVAFDVASKKNKM